MSDTPTCPLSEHEMAVIYDGGDDWRSPDERYTFTCVALAVVAAERARLRKWFRTRALETGLPGDLNAALLFEKACQAADLTTTRAGA